MTSQLLRTILLSIAIALPFWIAARVSRRRAAARVHHPVDTRHELLLAIFFLYLVTLAAITIVPRELSDSPIGRSDGINLVPVIRSIRAFLPGRNPSPESIRFWVRNLLGNVLLFVPLGLLLPLVTRRFRSLGRIALAGFLLSVGIEGIQYLSRFLRIYRSVDIDDVLLNTLGACLGYLCFAIHGRIARARPSRIRIVNVRR